MDALTQSQIESELKTLDGWYFEGNKIKKDFEFKNFKESLAFIVRLGIEAETHVHHPEITNVYNQVSLALSTHDAGGKVTQKDIDLANAIHAISG